MLCTKRERKKLRESSDSGLLISLYAKRKRRRKEKEKEKKEKYI